MMHLLCSPLSLLSTLGSQIVNFHVLFLAHLYTPVQQVEYLMTILFIYFVFLPFLGPLPWHMKVPRLGGLIRAVATRLRQSHSNARSDPRLRPTPQLMAMPDPEATEQGQGLNLQPHGS